jgi:hypothetical protein
VRVVLLDGVLGQLGAMAEGLVGEFVDDGGHGWVGCLLRCSCWWWMFVQWW